MLVALSLLFLTTDVISAQEKFCPVGEELIEGYCYHKVRLLATYDEASNECKRLGGKLPDNAVINKGAVTGWVTNVKPSSTSSYCIYGYPSPKGVLSAENQIYGIADCSLSLPLYCATNKQTCSSNEYEVDVGGQTECVRKLNGNIIGDDRHLCSGSGSSSVFDFNITGDTIDIVRGGENLTDVHWTSYNLNEDMVSASSIDKEKDINLGGLVDICFHRNGENGVELRNCDKSVGEFMCQKSSPVEIWSQTSEDLNQDLGDELVCNNTDDILCGQHCYSNRTLYKTKAEAEADCKDTGYVLAEHNVTHCVQHNGWVQGGFTGGKASGNQPTAPRCAFIANSGKISLGDCRSRAFALCYILKSDSSCNDTSTECDMDDGRKACLSPSLYRIAGHEAGDLHVSLCTKEAVFSGQILGAGDKNVFKKCRGAISEVVDKSGPLWIATRFLGTQLAFMNTENITATELESSSQQSCVRKQGDILVGTDCDGLHFYTCQQPAKKRSKTKEITIVVVLVVLPIIITAIIIFILYRQKGSKLCFSNPVVAMETTDQIWMNPVSEDNHYHNEKGSRRNTERQESTQSSKQ